MPTVEQIIGREDHSFNNATAGFAVGRDGNCYLANTTVILRVALDRSAKAGFVHDPTGSLIKVANGNAAGTIAVAKQQFAGRVTLFSTSFTELASNTGYLIGDPPLDYDAPSAVESDGTNFYAPDPHRSRIVKIDAVTGLTLATYALPLTANEMRLLRVNSGSQRFYVNHEFTSTNLRAYSFAGVLQASFALPGGTFIGDLFDVDAAGRVYIFNTSNNRVYLYSAAGAQLSDFALQFGSHAPTGDYPAKGLRFHEATGHLIIRRGGHPHEAFQVYDLAGNQVRVVDIDYERLAVTHDADPWTAGTEVGFAHTHTNNMGRTLTPRYRVWAKHFGDTAYEEWPLANGRVGVPADAAGIYHIKLSPEVNPFRVRQAPEYLVQLFAEVRAAGATGTVSVYTTNNRAHFGRGQAIQYTVKLKMSSPVNTPVTVRWYDRAAGRLWLEQSATLGPGQLTVTLSASAAVTAGLPPGDYLIVPEAVGRTCVPQPVALGHELTPAAFHVFLYGDYDINYAGSAHAGPSTAFDVLDLAVATARRAEIFGITRVVDRLGVPRFQGDLTIDVSGAISALRTRLAGDAGAVAENKTDVPAGVHHTNACYSAVRVQQLCILLENDAGLPLGEPFDQRTVQEMVTALQQVTTALLPYQAFAGWVWAANWFVVPPDPDERFFETAQQRTDYNAAVATARASGVWAAIIDTVNARNYGFALTAQATFRDPLLALKPGAVTAASLLPKASIVYAPVWFANVTEVDAHQQWEQVAAPLYCGFSVDVCRRPGKPTWVHPEIWNDDGTGAQIIPTAFAALARGATSFGCSGRIPAWGVLAQDKRTAYPGTASIFRALYRLLRQYGPWLTTLEDADDVAIVTTKRMAALDLYRGIFPTHQNYLYEAWVCCLYAGRPARLLYTEDVGPTTLRRYRAVLLVNQTVELDPGLQDRLVDAVANGVRVYYDASCRASLFTGLGFTALGFAFDKLYASGGEENGLFSSADDTIFYFWEQQLRPIYGQLRTLLSFIDPPATLATDNQELFSFRRRSGDGTFVFVVNETRPTAIRVGQLWRLNLWQSSRLPQAADVTFQESGVVYDVFGMRQLSQSLADCRSLPCRLYAILPERIGGVALDVLAYPPSPGDAFTIRVRVLDQYGVEINTTFPVRLRIYDTAGRVLHEVITHAAGGGSDFTLRSCAASGGYPANQRIEAVDLIAGLRASTLLFQ